MGKRGKINLVLPKNNASRRDVDAVLKILKNHGGECDAATLHSELVSYYQSQGKTLDNTTISHRSVTPRYFGLITYDKSEAKYMISEFGDYYISSNSWKDILDCIFLAISSVTFGKDNNAVSSNSIVEAPIVFLKMISDLGSVSISELAIALYYMEVDKMSYQKAIKKIRSLSNLAKETQKIKNNGAGKFFDPKFNLFFEDLEIVEKNNNKYVFTDYIKSTFTYFINELSAVNSIDANLEIDNVKNEIKDIKDLISELVSSDINVKPIVDKKEISQVGKLRVKRVARRIGFKSKLSRFNELQKSQIGWFGEKYINSLLQDYSSDIYNFIKIESNDAIDKIIWFNDGCTLDKQWEDKSIGHGCDLELITIKGRIIKLEVKSSYSRVPFFTATTNELIEMGVSKKDYFLVKIDNLRELATGKSPNITLINNPIDMLLNLSNIKEVSLYL